MSKLDEEKKDSKLLEMFKKVAEKQQNSDAPKFKLEPLRFNVSPLKKVSPTKKRGRPAKFSSNRSASTSVTDMFASRKKTKAYYKRTVEMIDPEVLAELPPEMVDEILKEYQMPDEDDNEDAKSVEDETVVQPEPPQESSDDNIFYQPSWRSLVKTWIDENEENVEWLSEKLQHDAAQLVRLKNLDLVYLAMRFLHRNIEDKQNEQWRCIYNQVTSELQSEMLKTYSKRLSVPENF